ncbi:MAG: hypothetical protein HDR54_06210 [Treponema sp.]|nr:hypothetical protein [Treponema sp.]MBD5407556.1 hypothetical protein [Treponema sp.]MBD5408963.1 hypothetical protein [Treponema sp.]
MYVFLLILMPLLCLFCYFISRNKISLVLSGIGVVTCVLFCILRSLLSFRHRVPLFSFASNFSYYCITEYAFPLVILYALYFLISRDTIELKVKSFLPLEAGFFAVYMPYLIITANSSPVRSFFELFVKPALFAALLILCAALIFFIARSVLEKTAKKSVLYSALLAVALFIPIFLNTLWLLGIFIPFVYAASGVFILCGFAIAVLMMIFKDVLQSPLE